MVGEGIEREWERRGEEEDCVPAATLYFLHVWRPERTSSSVRAGCRRLWSIILERSVRETWRVLGRSDILWVRGLGINGLGLQS